MARKGRTVYSDYGELFVTVTPSRSAADMDECRDKMAWNIRVKNRKTGKVWNPHAPLCTRHESKKRAIEDAVGFYEHYKEEGLVGARRATRRRRRSRR